MRLVVDANIPIALLLRYGITGKLFFANELELFAPEFLKFELRKHREMVRVRSVMSDELIAQLMARILCRIKFIPEEQLETYLKSAERICPDPGDVLYFALALHLRCPIWSNDKRLKEQKKISIYATHELVELLGISDHPSNL